MPTVYLQGRCSKPTDLPDVCAKCGAETSHRVNKTFNWYPPWIGITILLSPLIYIILAMVLRKSYTVAVPLCDQHKGHWVKRVLLVVGSLFLLGFGCVGIGVLLANAMPNNPDVGGIIALVVVVAIIAWLVVLVAANGTAIRPKEITDRGIRLTGVGQEFVTAYEEQEDSERDARRGAMDRWDERKSRRRDDDEDDRPRRRDDKRIRADDEEDERPRRPKREREDDY